MNLTYVTSNYGKYISVKEKFKKENIEIDYFKYDFAEPSVNDLELISKEKARQAYLALGSPVFVEDSGFYIVNYPNNPGYPGAFVKRSGVSSNIEKLLEDMKYVTDRECYFQDCVTYYDGKEFYQFKGMKPGTLSTTIKGDELIKAKSKLWHVFIPKNCNKTMAEMTDEERINRPDGRVDATIEFIKWYKNHQK